MLTEQLQNRLKTHVSHDLMRIRCPIESRTDREVKIGQRRYLNFSSNDYLSLAQHPHIKAQFIQAIEKFGIGSGASTAVCGYYDSHEKLEKAFASFLKRDEAILFNSGYAANLGVITSLASRTNTIISDKLCHASLLDAIQLSRAKHLRYGHHHIQSAMSLMQNNPGALLVTESVFSMEGDISPLPELISSCHQYNITPIVDDAHAIGVLGAEGGGIAEHFHLSQIDFPCVIYPLGKAFASMGAIVAGDKTIMTTLLQFARTYRYTTALPPAIAEAALATLTVIQSEPWRREKLKRLIHYFNHTALNFNLSPLTNDITPIRSILLPSNQMALGLQDHCRHNGFYVVAIRSPSVPVKQPRIRIVLNTAHNEEDIFSLLKSIRSYVK